MEFYKELETAGNIYRSQYGKSVTDLIAKMRKEADARRDALADDLQKNRETYRKNFCNMLGWPLNVSLPKGWHSVKKQFVAKDDLCAIYRVQLEIFENFWFYGILFVVNGKEKTPLIISQHGGLGTPELCSTMSGNSANYNDMTRRLLLRGANVFAPQTLLWDSERFGNDKPDRQQIDKELKQLGSSITAVEIYCIQKCIDYLLTMDCMDAKRIGMAGLSYGGFYTLFTAAVDPRIKAALSSCFFNNRYQYSSLDWVWFNAANAFLDAEIGALVYPRALYIEAGDEDPLFRPETAQQEFERLKRYYQGHEDYLQLHVFHGTHELCKSEEGMDFLFYHLNH